MGVKIQDLVFREKIDFSRLEGRIIAIDAPNIVMGLFNFSYKNKIYSYSESFNFAGLSKRFEVSSKRHFYVIKDIHISSNKEESYIDISLEIDYSND